MIFKEKIMTTIEAFKKAYEGQKIRRKVWNQLNKKMFIAFSNTKTKNKKHCFTYYQEKIDTKLTNDDLMANDWEIIKDK